MLQAAEWRGEDCHRRLNLGKGQPLRLLRMSINRNNERLCIFGINFFCIYENFTGRECGGDGGIFVRASVSNIILRSSTFGGGSSIAFLIAF
jgi:hypothetical protein